MVKTGRKTVTKTISIPLALHRIIERYRLKGGRGRESLTYSEVVSRALSEILLVEALPVDGGEGILDRVSDGEAIEKGEVRSDEIKMSERGKKIRK